MTLLSANQIAYIFRANDKEWYCLSEVIAKKQAKRKYMIKNFNSNIKDLKAKGFSHRNFFFFLICSLLCCKRVKTKKVDKH